MRMRSKYAVRIGSYRYDTMASMKDAISGMCGIENDEARDEATAAGAEPDALASDPVLELGRVSGTADIDDVGSPVVVGIALGEEELDIIDVDAGVLDDKGEVGPPGGGPPLGKGVAWVGSER